MPTASKKVFPTKSIRLQISIPIPLHPTHRTHIIKAPNPTIQTNRCPELSRYNNILATPFELLDGFADGVVRDAVAVLLLCRRS
jgi:hypothetical protein